MAAKFQPLSFFYSLVNHDFLKSHIQIRTLPSVFVYKEKMFFEFDSEFLLNQVSMPELRAGFFILLLIVILGKI